MNEIICGDSLVELKKFSDESVDLLCTDPPYGYSFMGKSWDKTLPEIGIFKECFRIMKAGAFAFVMSAPRSDVCARMMLLLEDAGFNIGFTPIYWTYASGFPKAMNIGKMVDKRNGVEREALPPKQFADGTTQRRTARAGIYSDEKGQASNTKGSSPLEGSYGGFQPKPAVEVVIVAMKPLSEKTFVDQALKNGKGITWLDDCRIGTEHRTNTSASAIFGTAMQKGPESQCIGRFPANLLVSDDVLNDGRIQKSGKAIKHNSGGQNFGGGTKPLADDIGYADIGSYSRYFSLDAWDKTLPFLIVPKASKREKNEGLSDREKVTVGDGPPVAIDNAFQRGKTERQNSHPTVKPLTLMSYLITLGSRPNDVVLDPFLGSGTTALAAKQLGRKYIGIEREKEYVEIAEARLKEIQSTLL